MRSPYVQPRRRMVSIVGQIDEEMANHVIAGLLFYQYEDPSRPAVVRIDSPGGSVTAGLAILDTFDFVRGMPIHTSCIRRAEALALSILAHGARGHRLAHPAARLSLGWPWSFDELPDAALSRELERCGRALSELLAADVGQSLADVERDMRAGLHLSATDAIEYGVIDGLSAPPRGPGALPGRR